jgi:hypothetical protein
MIVRGRSKRTAAAGSTPPVARRRLLTSFRTRLGAAICIAAAVLTMGVITASLVFTARAAPITPSTVPGVSQFGLSVPTLVAQTPAVQTSWLAAMKAAGITSVRMDADWTWVQPSGPKTFDWTAMDQVVKSARAAGMSVDLIIDNCPSWAALASAKGDTSPQPASAAQYATFAAEVAARYAPQGVGMFEIWNEPNNAAFWAPKPNPVAYTADLVAAYAAIKKVDPSAFIISGGLAPEATDGTNISPLDFLKAMYASGAKGSFDGLGYHPYSFPALPNTYKPWSAWSQMNQTNLSIRSVMTSNGDSGKKIWITEFGAPTSGPDGVGQAAQATQLTQAVAGTKATSWIGGLFMYSWQDDGTDPTNDEDWFGVRTAAGAPKLAYTALVNAIKS